MKKIIASLFIAGIFCTGCIKSNYSPTAPINEIPDITAELRFKGTFVDGPYGHIRGDAKIYQTNDNVSVALSGFNTSNGPDLHVYLSQEMQPVHFIDLGKIKSTSGNQLYSITGQPGFSKYIYVLIHCQLYDHLFGTAALK